MFQRAKGGPPCFTIVEIEHVLPGELETESETETVTVTVTDTETKQPTMYPNPAPGSDDKDPKEDQDPSKEVSMQAGKSCEGPKVDKWTLGEGPEWRERKDKINPKSGPILMSEIEGWSDEFTQNRSWTKCLGYSHKLFDQPSNRLYGKSVPKDLTPLNYGAVLSLIRLDIVSALLESNFLLVQQ